MHGDNSPLISVCIPVCNHEKYVQDTIESVIAQTYKNIELIVIDDGSKDNTWNKICELREKCERRFTRVVFEKQSNKGTCITCNKFREYLKGDYFALIASDDKYVPNALELLCDYLENHSDVGLVHGINLIMDKNGKQCYWKVSKFSFKNFYIDRYRLYYSYEDKINVYNKQKAQYCSLTEMMPMNINSLDYGSYESLIDKGMYISNGYLIRKSVLDQIPMFTNNAPLEDFWLILQIAKISKIRAIPKTTFYYRWHDSNAMKQKRKICDFLSKTLLWERDYVDKLENKKWKAILEKVGYSKKNYVNLGFVKVYKKRELATIKVIIEIFGKEFILIQKG